MIDANRLEKLRPLDAASAMRIRRSGSPALTVRRLGSGGPACLLIHGHADGGYVWDDFVQALTASHSAAIVDLRGHGDSDWDESHRYDVRAHVADIAHLIVATGMEKLVLIGHSLGAHIAMHIVGMFPARVAAMVCIDFGPCLNSSGMDQGTVNLKNSLRLYESVASYADWLKSTQPLASPDLLERLAMSALRPSLGGFRLKLDPALAEIDNDLTVEEEMLLWKLLRQILCPVLVLRGNASAIFPRTVAERMVKVLRHGRLSTIRMAGHAVMLDNPTEFAGSVMTFLAEAVPR